MSRNTKTFLLILVGTYINAELVVSKAERTIDLASQLVKITTHLTVHNGGSSVREVNVAVENSQSKYLAYIEVSVS